MNANSKTCPTCRAALPADAPLGLCPRCLIEGAAHVTLTDAALTATRPSGAPVTPATPAAFPGMPTSLRVSYFGDYELIDEIARGGMGVVYRARQVSLNRTVALKMILSGQLAGEAEVKRFRVEAEAAANLQHPHIVAIHEIGEHEGRHYFSMDYIEGKNLADHAQAQPLASRDAARLVGQIAAAVHYAHQRGTLHRDLKPQNVLIDAQGQPHITDFGLAKRWDATNPTAAAANSALTHTGAIMGSPSYMAPEQASGRLAEIGPASDVYSLGAILYQLLTGHPPHRGATVLETLRQVVAEEPAAPRRLRADIPADLETICLKCLEKRPERRYASARLLAEELERFLNHEPIVARPVSVLRKSWSWTLRHPWLIAVGATALLALTAATAFSLWQRFRFEHRQGLILRAQEIARAMPAAPAQRGARYEEGMGLLRAAAEMDPHADVLRVGLDLMARSGRAAQRILHGHGAGTEIGASAALGADGRQIAVAFTDGYAEVFALATGRSVFKSERLDFAQPRLAVSSAAEPALALIDAADPTAQVRLWPSLAGATARSFATHAGPATAVALSPDGRLLATGGLVAKEIGGQPAEVEIRLWAVETGRLLLTIPCFGPSLNGLRGLHERRRNLDAMNRITILRFSADGRVLSARNDLGAQEIFRLGEGGGPGGAWTATSVPASERSDPIFASAASRRLFEWGRHVAFDYYRPGQEMQRAWLDEAMQYPRLSTADGRWATLGFLVSDARAAAQPPTPMPGRLIALTPNGEWLTIDAVGAALEVRRPAEVTAEWQRTGLWEAVQAPSAWGGRFDREIRLFLTLFGTLVFAAIVAVIEVRITIRRCRGLAVSRLHLATTLVLGVVAVSAGTVLAVRLATLYAWYPLSEPGMPPVHNLSIGWLSATICWGLSAVVRAAQEYHATLTGQIVTGYRASKLAVFGGAVASVFTLRSMFESGLFARLQTANHAPAAVAAVDALREQWWWWVALSLVAGGLAAFLLAQAVQRHPGRRQGLRLAWVAAYALWLAAAHLILGEPPLLSAAVCFGVGSLAAIIVVPPVYAFINAEAEERQRRILARRQKKAAVAAAVA